MTNDPETIERARRLRRDLHMGDIVAPAHEHFPKGVVKRELPLHMVAVEWPDGILLVHHESTLRKVC